MDITFYPTCGCNSFSGYGRYEIGLARGLVQAGARLNLHADPGRPTVQVGFAEWLEAPHVQGTRRYLATLSESTLVSEQWVELINREAAGVLLPTASLVEVYRNSGVTVPLINIGYAVDPVAEPVPYRAERSKFRFLTYSYGDTRKGADMVLTAFMALYKGNPDYELVIKAREGYDATWLRTLGALEQVTLIDGVQSGGSWAELLRSSHCFVFPSRAEGIGLPPRESVLAHVPAIATNWLGMDDADHWAAALPVNRLTPAIYDDYQANRRGAQWAEPDWLSLKAWMQAIPLNYQEAYRMATAGARYLRSKTWRAVGEAIVAGIREAEGAYA